MVLHAENKMKNNILLTSSGRAQLNANSNTESLVIATLNLI